MSDMIERVAKAIFLEAFRGMDQSDGAVPWEQANEIVKPMYRRCAAAALKEIENPTARMISEGESAATVGIGKPVDEEAIPRIWRAMHAAAFKH